MPRGRGALCSFFDGLSGPRDGRGGRSPGGGSGSVPVRAGGGPFLASSGATRGMSVIVPVGGTGAG